MRVAYFTAGSLGAGHQIRGLAIGRAIERQAAGCELRLFLPVEPFPALQPLLAQYRPQACPIDPDELFCPDRAPGSLLSQALHEFSPEVLIVDLFWAPLVHILTTLDCETWLIVRSCPVDWFAGTARARFDSSAYQRVIGIEPLENPIVREFVNPIVVCNPDEARTREEVCEAWSLAHDAYITAITHAGLAGEIDYLQSAYDSRQETSTQRISSVIRADLRGADAIAPLAPWLPAVDQVFSAAGYNSYWEARWMGFAHKTTLMAISRRIDDPQARIRLGGNLTMSANGADELVSALIG